MTEEDSKELLRCFENLLAAVIEYKEYEWSGDPWEEDARAMGEMTLDDMARDGSIDGYKSLLDRLKQATAG